MSREKISSIIGIALTVLCVISTVVCFIVPEDKELLPTLVTAGCAIAVLVNGVITWRRK